MMLWHRLVSSQINLVLPWLELDRVGLTVSFTSILDNDDFPLDCQRFSGVECVYSSSSNERVLQLLREKHKAILEWGLVTHFPRAFFRFAAFGRLPFNSDWYEPMKPERCERSFAEVLGKTPSVRGFLKWRRAMISRIWLSSLWRSLGLKTL